jgi:hypothetical protein
MFGIDNTGSALDTVAHIIQVASRTRRYADPSNTARECGYSTNPRPVE